MNLTYLFDGQGRTGVPFALGFDDVGEDVLFFL